MKKKKKRKGNEKDTKHNESATRQHDKQEAYFDRERSRDFARERKAASESLVGIFCLSETTTR